MDGSSEKELFDNFLLESAETLRDLEKQVIHLEKTPSDRDTLDVIFRNMHSLKGNCSLFGITGIKMVSHALENLLSRVRERKMEADRKVIDIVLRGTDFLREMFNDLLQNRQEGQLTPDQEEYLSKINLLFENGGEQESFDSLRKELLRFINQPEVRNQLELEGPLKEAFSIIRATAPNLLTERRHVAGEPLSYHGMDVSREFYAVWNACQEVLSGTMAGDHYAIVSDTLSALIEKHRMSGDGEPMELLSTLRDDLEMLYQDETGFDEILEGMTREGMEKYRKMLSAKKAERGEVGVPPSSPTSPSTAEAMRSRQIKVDQGKVDKTIELAGEIVTVSEFFNYLQTQFTEGKVSQNMNSLKDAIASLQELSDTLSRRLFDIRKVPIAEAFQNLPRLVRDTAVVTGKKAHLSISGEDTAVDKSIIARLETVLVHMIRNSIDHGIESPQERIAAGKGEEGSITLSALPRGAMLVITVTDDGHGIDAAKLRKAVVEKGLFDAKTAEGMSEKQLIDQIFVPGFSLSDEVTETSGRGVGMDVVYSSIQELGGAIRLDNLPGQGLTSALTIPFTHTTLIKKGLAVAVGHGVYLIPIEAVIESFRPSPDEIYTVEGKKEIIKRRGEILPLVKLWELFGTGTKVKAPTDGIVVLVQNKRNRSCFLVDYVIGQRQIIYKRLTVKTNRAPAPFEGVSVYDGSRLAMILDIDGIISQSQQ